MPIYEYACKSCNHTLDALQKIGEEPLVDCPECGEAQLRRLISAPRFRLKGEGWYETDFKKDNRRNLATSDAEAPKDKSGEKAAGDGKGQAKSEGAKAADKPPAKAPAGKRAEPAKASE